MNLEKLFATQKVLRDRINYNEPDRFDKLVLALLVELGECANEWRGFKFWSKDQESRTKIPCEICEGNKEIFSSYPEFDMIECPHCDGSGIEKPGNPLLEEYVDGLHFVLEIGLEMKITPKKLELLLGDHKKVIGSIENHFGYIYNRASELMDTGSDEDKSFRYFHVTLAFIGLGYRLGFTWEEIEKAYYDKNKVNHQRQTDGY